MIHDLELTMKRIPLFFQMLLMVSLAGAESVRLWDDSHVPGIFVEATVDDSLNGIFMLDTGATAFGLVLDSASFARLDTSSFSRKPQPMELAFYRAEYMGDVRIAIGENVPQTYEDMNVLVFEESRMPTRNLTRDFNVIGIIGYPLFAGRITSIDFDNNTLCILDSLPMTEGFTPIKLTKTESGFRFMEVEGLPIIRRKKPASVVFDTGNLWGIILKKGFIRQPPSSSEIQRYGMSEYVRWRADSVTIGGLTLNNVPLRYDRNGVGKEYSVELGEGLLGMAVMKRFNMIIDFKHDILFLKPNHYFNKKNKTSK